jgi:hypothetical protein
LQCPPGTYCIKGSPIPFPCAAGTYQDSAGNDTCRDCLAGSYCPPGSNSLSACPIGYYCPLSTQFANQFPCPNGTYSDVSGIASISECKMCSPGKYCEYPGLSKPTANCSIGFFCGGGSSVATPRESAGSSLNSYVGSTCASTGNGTRNDVCPPGHYCPSGSSSPLPCLAGTNSTSFGLGRCCDCPACTAGFYCPDSGTALAIYKCNMGFYCPNGTVTPSLRCPSGSFCSIGSSAPSPCAAGYYQD